ncbi:MAG TPA: hypothetical protein VFM88_14660 [Vicinamibacteria bacterium]|nr:hypothetical protein [Vicinamibacteria bacterium]
MKRGVSRRAALRSALGALALGAYPARARAADYATAKDALEAIEGFEAGVERFYLRLDRTTPASRLMIASFRRDRHRHRAHRDRIRRRLGVPRPEAAAASESASGALPDLREALSSLVYAHAEALPALGDPVAVSLLLADLVDLARHLTVVDLWIEAEADRG